MKSLIHFSQQQGIKINKMNLSLPSFRITDGCIPYVSYMLVVERNGVSWTIDRSFHELECFYRKMQSVTRCLPTFAPSTFFPSMDRSFLQKRKSDMERCMRAVLSIPDIEKNLEVRDFLEFKRAKSLVLKTVPAEPVEVERVDDWITDRELLLVEKENDNLMKETENIEKEEALDIREKDLAAREMECQMRMESLEAERKKIAQQEKNSVDALRKQIEKIGIDESHETSETTIEGESHNSDTASEGSQRRLSCPTLNLAASNLVPGPTEVTRFEANRKFQSPRIPLLPIRLSMENAPMQTQFLLKSLNRPAPMENEPAVFNVMKSQPFHGFAMTPRH